MPEAICCCSNNNYVVVIETLACYIPFASLRSEEVLLKNAYLLLFTNMYCCDIDVND